MFTKVRELQMTASSKTNILPLMLTHSARRLQRRLAQLGGTIEKGTILGEYVGEVCTKASVVARTHVFLTGACVFNFIHPPAGKVSGCVTYKT